MGTLPTTPEANDAVLTCVVIYPFPCQLHAIDVIS